MCYSYAECAVKGIPEGKRRCPGCGKPMPAPRTRRESRERQAVLADKRKRANAAVKRAQARDKETRDGVVKWAKRQPVADRVARIDARLADPSLMERGRTAERRALETARAKAVERAAQLARKPRKQSTAA